MSKNGSRNEWQNEWQKKVQTKTRACKAAQKTYEIFKENRNMRNMETPLAVVDNTMIQHQTENKTPNRKGN